MSRIGAIAAAPFLGGQFVSLYRGATRVPTVPGKPVIVIVSSGGGQVSFDTQTPDNDGGAVITAIRYYINGDFAGEKLDPDVNENANADESIVPCEPGDIARASFVNAIGEGPLSDPVIVEEV